jgi:hypothetical protein
VHVLGVFLVGCIEAGRPVTKGTSTLINFNGAPVLVTCRHVIEQCGARPFVVTVRNRSVFGTSGDRVDLRQPLFHPDDTDRKSWDLAVYQGVGLPQEVPPLAFALDLTSPEVGAQLRLIGFPVAHLERHFVPDSRDVLVPYTSAAVFARAPLHRLSVNGFARDLYETQFAYSRAGERATDGISGGAVLGDDGRLVGVVIAGVRATLTVQGQSADMNGAAFVPSARIAEALPRAP